MINFMMCVQIARPFSLALASPCQLSLDLSLSLFFSLSPALSPRKIPNCVTRNLWGRLIRLTVDGIPSWTSKFNVWAFNTITPTARSVSPSKGPSVGPLRTGASWDSQDPLKAVELVRQSTFVRVRCVSGNCADGNLRQRKSLLKFKKSGNFRSNSPSSQRSSSRSFPRSFCRSSPRCFPSFFLSNWYQPRNQSNFGDKMRLLR